MLRFQVPFSQWREASLPRPRTPWWSRRLSWGRRINPRRRRRWSRRHRRRRPPRRPSILAYAGHRFTKTRKKTGCRRHPHPCRHLRAVPDPEAAAAPERDPSVRIRLPPSRHPRPRNSPWDSLNYRHHLFPGCSSSKAFPGKQLLFLPIWVRIEFLTFYSSLNLYCVNKNIIFLFFIFPTLFS